MERIVRMPQQKRSILKKNKIIEAAYEIFNQKGFHNTNTAEIAKRAGISTGSIYAYYKDKKDIFIELIKNYGDIIYDLVVSKFEEIPKENNISKLIEFFININIERHNMSQRLHNEAMALTYLDNDIKKIFHDQREKIINEVISQFKKRNIFFENEREKALIMYMEIDSVCNEFIFNNQTGYNKDIVIRESASMLEKLIT